jgi:hypothetical protein
MMTHPQTSRTARRARHNEQPRGEARGGPSGDPQLHRMLASHIHCGEPMQLLSVNQSLPNEGYAGRNGRDLLTYKCACGFSFDQQPD